MGFEKLTKELTTEVKKAFQEIQESIPEDIEEINKEVMRQIELIFLAMKDGKSIDQIVEDADAKTKAIAAACLFKVAKNQREAASKLEKVLDGFTGIIMRAVLLNFAGITL